ncbi:MAG TPA: amidohydrolase [Holophagaceae bacterium]|nr:amidohydrolase [Holophagaceae bacterium]
MQTPPPPPPAYLLLKGADVWTGEALRTGQAVVVKGHKILAVGPEATMAKAHAKAKVVELKGGTLLPGLIEGHAHVGGLGKLKAQVDLVGCQDLPEALGRVREWSAAHPQGWVVGRGWDQNRWPSKAFPAKGDLDRLTGTRPAVLFRVDGHALWANSAALDLAGIDKDTPDPEGGRILRNEAGLPTGILVDNAMNLVEKVLPTPSAAEVEGTLVAGLKALRAEGFTAVCDMGITAADLAAYRHLATAGTLPIRVFAYLSHDRDLMLKELRAPRPKATGWFQIQGVKFYMDGALGSRGARLLAPYADAPETQGLWVTDPALVARDAAITLRSGYQPAIHAIGDAANRAALDLLSQARRKAQNHVLPRIEHAQIVTAEDAARFGSIGVVASVQPVHCTSDHSWTPRRLGPERTPEAFPWRRFLDGKALLAFGSDAPVEDANPFISLAAAQTRQDPDGNPPGGFLPDQRLTPDEALMAYTAWNAKALGHADLGVIRAGAVADLLWVEVALPTADAAALRKLRPGRLWVNGLETTP